MKPFMLRSRPVRLNRSQGGPHWRIRCSCGWESPEVVKSRDVHGVYGQHWIREHMTKWGIPSWIKWEMEHPCGT